MFMIVFVLLISFTVTVAFADTNIKINGVLVEYDEDSGIPFIDENGRTQVPFRKTMEAVGATVSWRADTRVAVAQRDTVVVEVPIDKSHIYKNYVKVENDTAALIKDGRTYLPIRVVMESFGFDVGWDGATRTVEINEPYQDMTVYIPSEVNVYFEEWIMEHKTTQYNTEGSWEVVDKKKHLVTDTFSVSKGTEGELIYELPETELEKKVYVQWSLSNREMVYAPSSSTSTFESIDDNGKVYMLTELTGQDYHKLYVKFEEVGQINIGASYNDKAKVFTFNIE